MSQIFRSRTASGQILRTYAPNALNQYDTISVNPRLLNVRGRASTSANVTVNTGTEADPNFLPVQRSGGLFAAEAVVNNANTPDFLRVWIEASQEGAGKDGQTLRTKRTGGIYVPPATSQLSYDLDGNLTDDPRWHYTWDAENRLISMETQASAAAAGVPRQRLEFAYDSRSRRIAKRVLSARSDGILPSSVTWTLDHETRFLWDGWRLMAEVESKSAAVPFAVVRSYTWGLDVSGSLEGAGCVGGLLAVNSALPAMNAQSPTVSSVAYSGGGATLTLLPTYDGNGNITALVNAATGVALAHWDYDPFGNRLTDAEPAWQELCPFGFSTKYEDTESGLVYYGFRYYSPELGRWVNRDPIEEAGGMNLLSVAVNNLVNSYDVLGKGLPPKNVNGGIPTDIRLDYDTVDGPKATGPCGAAIWVISWKLSKAAPRGGEIMQRVTMIEEERKSCDGKDLRQSRYSGVGLKYTEAFHVNPNALTATSRDHFIVNTRGGCTRGRFIIIGDAEFHDAMTGVPPTSHRLRCRRQTV